MRHLGLEVSREGGKWVSHSDNVKCVLAAVHEWWATAMARAPEGTGVAGGDEETT